jgi:hypothetical protein
MLLLAGAAVLLTACDDPATMQQLRARAAFDFHVLPDNKASGE